MVWCAGRVVHGRKPNWLAWPFGAAVWLIVILGLPDESSTMRLTIGAGFVAAYAVLTANELWSEQRKAMHEKMGAMHEKMQGGMMKHDMMKGKPESSPAPTAH